MKEAEIIRRVWDIFSQVLDIRDHRLFLFGSRGQRKNDPYADFDFCIVGSFPVGWKKMSQIKAEVEMLPTLYSIDIVDFQSASKDFQRIAKRGWKEIIHGKIRSE